MRLHPRKIPLLAVGFIAFREGYSETPTDLVDGYSTVGYGHLIAYRPVSAEDHRAKWVDGQDNPGRLSRPEALKLLRKDLRATAKEVRRLVRVPTNKRQFSMLVSFAYNCGTGALSDSTLLKKLNAGNYAAVPDELMRWVNGPAGPLPGLVKRRRREGRLFRPLHQPSRRFK